ncbi:MAG: hypothetical protein ACTS22_08225 [Phycisphaerales bacterium]
MVTGTAQARVFVSAVASGLLTPACVGAQLEPAPESAFAARAEVRLVGVAPYPGRLSVSEETGLLALGRVGPGTGSWYRARAMDIATGDLQDAGSRSVPDPDAAVWDDAGAIGPAGSILVGGVHGIYAVAPSGAVTQAIPRGGWLQNPEDMRFASDGSLIVADYSNRTLYRYDPDTGQALPLAVFARGILQFALDESDTAFVVDADGGVAVVPPIGGIASRVGAGFYAGVAKGPDHSGWAGAVYACEMTTGDLIRVMPDGSQERLFVGLFAPAQPDPDLVLAPEAELTFTPGGALLVAIVSTGEIYAITDPCSRTDTNGNGFVEPGDFAVWVSLYIRGDIRADADFSGILDMQDFSAWMRGYAECPRDRLR